MTEPAAAQLARCEHCGLPLGRRAGRYCCLGCALVHGLTAGGDVATTAPSDRLLSRVAVSAFLAMGVMVFSLSLYGIDPVATGESARALQGLMRMGALLLSMPVWFLLGLPLAASVVRQRRWFSAESLIAFGVAAALVVSLASTLLDRASVYFETATMVLVLYSLGRWLDVRTRERARASLETLIPKRLPAVQRIEDEREVAVEAESLGVGDVFRLRPGEWVPADGVVLEGQSFLDASSLNGEAEPVTTAAGDRVLAGTRLVDGTLLVRATAVQGTRVMDEIARLLATAAENRADLVRMADRITAWFSPLVLLLSLGTLAWHAWFARAASLERGLFHALCVALIACPCALGMATPLAFWVGIGEAWRRGILVRGGDVFERLARIRRVVFDKTGTLTTASMSLERIEVDAGADPRAALRLAAALELGSEHPIGKCLVEAQRRVEPGTTLQAERFRRLPGIGVEGWIAGRCYSVRRAANVASTAADPSHTIVELHAGEQRLASFLLSASLRPEAHAVVRELERRGLEPIALTGDCAAAAAALSSQLEIPVLSQQLPGDKAAYLAAQGRRGTLFVGDGLNDAPGLALADVGIAMRTASPSSLRSAAVNLLRDDLGLVVSLLDLSRATVATARLNLVWAFAYNGVGLGLAVLGRLTPVFAALAMVLSSALTAGSTLRLRRSLRSAAAPGAVAGISRERETPRSSTPSPERAAQGATSAI